MSDVKKNIFQRSYIRWSYNSVFYHDKIFVENERYASGKPVLGSLVQLALRPEFFFRFFFSYYYRLNNY